MAVISNDLGKESELEIKFITIFSIYHFLYVYSWYLSSKVNIKWVNSCRTQWPWQWGQRSKPRSWQYSAYIISSTIIMFTFDSEALKSILSNLTAQWPWKWGQRSNSRSSSKSLCMNSYLNVQICKLYCEALSRFGSEDSHYNRKSD